MLIEVTSAANFLTRLVRLSKLSASLTDQQFELFHLALVETLRSRFTEHWFPERPFKGSGYRCIRINGMMDPVLGQAGKRAGIKLDLLRSLFPSELTMWIDPREVSYRFGENGSICVLYDQREVEELAKLNSLSSSPASSSPASSASTSPSPSQMSYDDSNQFIMDTRNILAMEHFTFVSS